MPISPCSRAATATSFACFVYQSFAMACRLAVILKWGRFGTGPTFLLRSDCRDEAPSGAYFRAGFFDQPLPLLAEVAIDIKAASSSASRFVNWPSFRPANFGPRFWTCCTAAVVLSCTAHERTPASQVYFAERFPHIPLDKSCQGPPSLSLSWTARLASSPATVVARLDAASTFLP